MNNSDQDESHKTNYTHINMNGGLKHQEKDAEPVVN